MNDEQKKATEENGWQTEGESLNTGSADQQNTSAEHTEEHHKKGGIHNNALYAAGMGRPATGQVDPHSNSGLAQTGTNTSYEGPTAPGAGGSAGSGYTSGQSGVDSSITTDSDYDQAREGKSQHKNTQQTSNEQNGGKEEDDDAKNTLI